MGAFDRTRLLLGDGAMEKLKNARVAVFGPGGVGGFVVEALARCGVGGLERVDHDTISESNINRQCVLRALRGRPAHRRRSGEGSDEIKNTDQWSVFFYTNPSLSGCC